MIRLAAALLLIPGMAFSAIDGVVINRTTGKPQAGVSVTLLKLGAGMQSAGTAKSGPAGEFRLDASLDGPALLQASFEDVNYNKMLPPGSPSSGLELEVFHSVAQPGSSRVDQHMMLVEPAASGIAVNESIVYQNTGNTTFNAPGGTLRFYLPPAAGGKVEVNVTGSGGMPLSRQAEKTSVPNVYAVKFPVRPGETRFDLNYNLPPSTSLDGRVLHDGSPVRIVAPNGVTLTSPQLTVLGREPRTQATVYQVQGDSFQASIEGAGSLREAARAMEGQQEDAGPPIEQKNPKVYTRLTWVLLFSFTILACGMALVYRRA